MGAINFNFSKNGDNGDGRGRIVADTDSENTPMRSITFVTDLNSSVMNSIAQADSKNIAIALATFIHADLDYLFPDIAFLESLGAAQGVIVNGMGKYQGCRISFALDDNEVYFTVSPLEENLTVADMRERSYFSEFPRLPTPNDYAEITKVHSDNETNYYTYLPSEDIDEAFKKFGDYAVYIEQKGFTVYNQGTSDYPILNGNGSQIATLSLKKEGDTCLFVFALKK